MEIRSLSDTSSNKLFQAFRDAFMDYEMQLDQHELDNMLKRRGFDPELSFGAFDRDRLVAFTFNGTGKFRGVKTAYDTGTGTVKAYRGQGLAGKIFQYSIPWLKKAGIRQYLLEVLQHNESAVKLYRRLGFEVTREFYYYVMKKADLNLQPVPVGSAYHLEKADVPELLEAFDFSDIVPSWQNSNDSIRRGLTRFSAMTIRYRGEVIATCIYEPGSGDITSMAVSPGHRRKGLGTSLLDTVIRDISSDVVKVINIPTDADGVTAFLSSCNMQHSGKQFEMIRAIL